MAFITSRVSASNDYVLEWTSANGMKKAKRTFHVNGGADVINKKTLLTPSGVITEISDDELEALKKNDPLFCFHLNNNTLVIRGTEKEAEKAKTELEKDKSSQLTPEDYENGNEKKEMFKKNAKKPRVKK